jgi:hypothetical protein
MLNRKENVTIPVGKRSSQIFNSSVVCIPAAPALGMGETLA